MTYTTILEQEEKILRLKQNIEEFTTEAIYEKRVPKLKYFKGVNTLTVLSGILEDLAKLMSLWHI